LAFGIGILVSVWGLQLTGLCCSCSRCRSRRWRRCLRRRRLVVVYRVARWSLLFGVSYVRAPFRFLCTFLGPANRTLSLQLKRKMLAICCRSLSRPPYAHARPFLPLAFPHFPMCRCCCCRCLFMYSLGGKHRKKIGKIQSRVFF